MSENSIKGILDVTMDKVRAMCDADTIIGKPIVAGDDVTIIPISKVSYGFASGGSDFPTKNGQGAFGGGGGAGMTISPTAFLVIKGSDVRMMQVSNKPDAADKAVAMLPELVDKITALFKKDNEQEQI